MSAPGQPIVQRSCALCGVVDAGPRHTILLPSGREAFYHNPGDADCRVPDSDPHPEVDEHPAASQLRHALTNDPGSPTPADTEDLATAPDFLDAWGIASGSEN